MIELPNADEYETAIARVKNNPSNASERDWELVNRAAQQAGDMGNRARAARGDR